MIPVLTSHGNKTIIMTYAQRDINMLIRIMYDIFTVYIIILSDSNQISHLLPSTDMSQCGRSEGHYGSHENADCEIMNVLLNSFLCYEQSDWPKKVITVFMTQGQLHVTRNRDSSDLPPLRHVSRGKQVRDLILMVFIIIRQSIYQRFCHYVFLSDIPYSQQQDISFCMYQDRHRLNLLILHQIMYSVR